MESLFACFDIFPMPKGASVHISHNLNSMASQFEEVRCICLGNNDMPAFQRERNIQLHRCQSHHPNFLKRTELYSLFCSNFISNYDQFQLIHFRDMWSGLPLLTHKKSKKVFEVNGLPSIELPLRYPRLFKNRSLLNKLESMENYCLKQSDAILTVSDINAHYLLNRGVESKKISVIANTAEVNQKWIKKEQRDDNFILYAGTLSPWQGLPILLKAFKLVQPSKVRLVLACSTRKFLKKVKKNINRYELENLVRIQVGLSPKEIKNLYQKALFSVAPLTRCDRNELQGCSPIKIIESMAEGTPVIASNLAVNRSIITENEDGLFFLPDSVRSLACQMEKLIEDIDLVNRLSKCAQNKIHKQFSLDNFNHQLKNVYQSVLS